MEQANRSMETVMDYQALVRMADSEGLSRQSVFKKFKDAGVTTLAVSDRTIMDMAGEGLVRGKDFKVWLMAEIPSNIILADQFNKYVDGYSIGSNDLTMLILGCDRDNDTVSHIYDERNLAVRRAIRHLIEVAHKDGKTVSICGQAPSVYPEFCEFLIKSGIDSMSVNPDTVKFTKKLAAQLEQRIMLDALTGRGRVETENLDW